MYLVKHKYFDEYKTVKKPDLWRMKQFPNFIVIKDEEEVSRILKENFTSKDRGEPYNPDLPSATQIIGELFPIDFSKEYGLIRWMNDKNVVDSKSQKKSSNKAMDKGTALHKVLERYLIDKSVIGDDFEPYLESSSEDKISESDREILETLETFKINEAGKIEKIKTEFFLETSYCQGTVDLICNYEGKLTLGDWKTTSKQDKKTGRPRFYYKSDISQYLRQLSLYTIMLQDEGILTLDEIKNLEYRIFQFHFLLKDYKVFEIPRDQIFALEKDIVKVLGWYQKHLKK